MADKYLTEFVDGLRAMDDESLLKTLVRFNAAPEEYRPEAMAAAKEEMARRRLTPAHLSEAASHEMQEALDSVFDEAIGLAEDGRTIAEIQAHLKTRGLDKIRAAEMAKRAWDMPSDQRKRAGQRNAIVGMSLCFGGLLFTAVTYYLATTPLGGGRYVITWGIVVVGLLQFVRGVRQLTR